MKKLLKAFTLAEVLITLGIVGVVARVTLPALTQNVQQQTTETAFAKAINTLESVNEKMKLESGSKTLTRSYNRNNDTGLFLHYYLEALGNHMNGVCKHTNYTINGINYNTYVFTAKDGMIYTSTSPGSYSGSDRSNSPKYYSAQESFLTIDVNGRKGPNKYGKDQFDVVIDNYGAVIPYGSAQYAEFKGTNNILWENGCPSRKNVKPANPRACSGSIADNGYKILYGYNSL